jgi:hypothetical protein
MKRLLTLAVIGWWVTMPCLAQTNAPAAVEKKTVAKSAPGWLVDVFEHEIWKDFDTSKDVLTRIVVRPSTFTLDSHLQSFPGNNLVFYRGSAVFKPAEAGRYTFYMVSPEGPGSCILKLQLADRPIINVAPPKYADNNQVAVGGADLEEQPYSIQFQAGCNGNKATINIKVRSPQDMSPRDFQNNELFYVRK